MTRKSTRKTPPPAAEPAAASEEIAQTAAPAGPDGREAVGAVSEETATEVAAEVQAAEPAVGVRESEGTATETPPSHPDPEVTSDPDPEVFSDPVAVVVIGPKKGRWRAGRHFTAEPVTIPIEELTEVAIEALEADPALTVRFDY